METKHNLLLLLLASLPCDLVQANDNQSCVDLEYSNLARPPSYSAGGFATHDFVLSNNQQLIALYEDFHPKKVATFKLWDSQTGKLLKAKKLDDYEERSSQIELNFSPDNSFVYLEGMTDGVPFWHLDKNEVIFSPCETAMGIIDVQFSDDLEVAYTETIDSFKSLCKTGESKALAVISYGSEGDFIFDGKTKHLFVAHLSAENHKSYMQDIGQGNKHATLFQKYPYNPSSDDTFATLFVNSLPNPRLLVAKTQGGNLSLSLWSYENNQIKPKKKYLHNLSIPKLKSKKNPIAKTSKMLASHDKKKAVFLSNSGVLMLFDIETGKVIWKNHLAHPNADADNYSFGEALSTAVVIKRKEPQALLFYDWKSGEQRVLDIPKEYSYNYQIHGQYFVYINEDKNRILLVNRETRQRRVVNVPSGFELRYYPQITNSQQLMFKSEDTYKRESPYTILILDMDSGKYRVLKAPFDNDKYSSPEYFTLAQDHNKIQAIEQLTGTKKKESNENPPELLTILYDKQKRQSKFCRLKLRHKH